MDTEGMMYLEVIEGGLGIEMRRMGMDIERMIREKGREMEGVMIEMEVVEVDAKRIRMIAVFV
jgi:hypothetical protein